MNDPELWPRLLHPDDRARALAENVRHNETGEPYRLEYRMLHRDGHVVWVYDEARVVRDADGKVRVLARRDARHHRTQEHGRPGRLPHVPRRAHRSAVARDVRGARRAVGRAGAPARGRRRGALRRPDRLPARERLARPHGRRRAARRGRRPAARGDPRDRPRRAARRGPVPAVARRPGPRRIRPRRRGAPRRVGRAADQPGVRRAVHGRRDRGLHQRGCGDQPVPTRRRHRCDA